jgi:hypothetical protein
MLETAGAGSTVGAAASSSRAGDSSAEAEMSTKGAGSLSPEDRLLVKRLQQFVVELETVECRIVGAGHGFIGAGRGFRLLHGAEYRRLIARSLADFPIRRRCVRLGPEFLRFGNRQLLHRRMPVLRLPVRRSFLVDRQVARFGCEGGLLAHVGPVSAGFGRLDGEGRLAIFGKSLLVLEAGLECRAQFRVEIGEVEIDGFLEGGLGRGLGGGNFFGRRLRGMPVARLHLREVLPLRLRQGIPLSFRRGDGLRLLFGTQVEVAKELVLQVKREIGLFLPPRVLARVVPHDPGQFREWIVVVEVRALGAPRHIVCHAFSRTE